MAIASPSVRVVGAQWHGTLDGRAVGVEVRQGHAVGPALDGRLRYDDALSEKVIRLGGSARPGASFEWIAHEEGPDRTDREVGRLSGTIGDGGRRLQGQWVPAGGTPKPVRLDRVAEYKLWHPARTGHKVSEIYPVTGRQEIDSALSSLRRPMCTEHRCMNTISLVTLSDGAMSALASYWFDGGGAHGNTEFAAINWRRSADGWEPVRLRDLIDPTPACRRMVDEVLVGALRKMGATNAAAGALPEAAYRQRRLPFTMHRNGLLIHYPPYAVGAYAEGAFHVPLPYQALGDCVRLKPV